MGLSVRLRDKSCYLCHSIEIRKNKIMRVPKCRVSRQIIYHARVEIFKTLPGVE